MGSQGSHHSHRDFCDGDSALGTVLCSSARSLLRQRLGDPLLGLGPGRPPLGLSWEESCPQVSVLPAVKAPPRGAAHPRPRAQPPSRAPWLPLRGLCPLKPQVSCARLVPARRPRPAAPSPPGPLLGSASPLPGGCPFAGIAFRTLAGQHDSFKFPSGRWGLGSRLERDRWLLWLPPGGGRAGPHWARGSLGPGTGRHRQPGQRSRPESRSKGGGTEGKFLLIHNSFKS